MRFDIILRGQDCPLWGHSDLGFWHLTAPQTKSNRFILQSSWIFAPILKRFPRGGPNILCSPGQNCVLLRSPGGGPLTFDHRNLISSSLGPSKCFWQIGRNSPELSHPLEWDGQTDRQTDGWTDWQCENSLPPSSAVAGAEAKKGQEVDIHGC